MMIGRGALLLAVTASLLQVVSAVRSKKLEGAVASQRQQQQKQLAPAVALGAKEEFLSPEDGVAVTFWIISISMVAATVFFLMESMAVKSHWKTSMNVGALVTLVAAVHYFYMREYWVKVHESPILYRYIDWSVTVPLQMIEFYLILAAVKKVGQGMFWRLLLGTVAMLTFGYLGEAGYVNVWLGFALGMAGWFFILYEIFAGEAGQMANSGAVTESVKSSFNTMRLIVTAGWSIYPLGYVCGYLMTGPDTVTYLNLLYNVADFVNKIGFCVSVWACAKAEK
jgi:bacteriorhodopsin